MRNLKQRRIKKQKFETLNKINKASSFKIKNHNYKNTATQQHIIQNRKPELGHRNYLIHENNKVKQKENNAYNTDNILVTNIPIVVDISCILPDPGACHRASSADRRRASTEGGRLVEPASPDLLPPPSGQVGVLGKAVAQDEVQVVQNEGCEVINTYVYSRAALLQQQHRRENHTYKYSILDLMSHRSAHQTTNNKTNIVTKPYHETILNESRTVSGTAGEPRPLCGLRTPNTEPRGEVRQETFEEQEERYKLIGKSIMHNIQNKKKIQK